MPRNAQQNVITDAATLKPGWYCVGFENEEGDINWGGSPIYHYVGDGCWEDDDGNAVDYFFDTFLQLNVSTDAADAYLPQ